MILTIAIISSLILCFIPISSGSNQSSIVIYHVKRDFSISRNGIVQIIDNYAIMNNGTDPVSSIYLGLDEDYYSKISYISAYDINGFELDLEHIPNIGNGFEQWILFLTNPLSPGKIKNFSITMEFVDLISISTEKRISIQFSKYPASPYSIRKYDVTIYSPSDTTIHNPYTDMDATPPVNAPPEENISAWKNDVLNFYVTFTTNTPMQGFVSVLREINLNHIGYIQVIERHSVRNIGPIGMGTLDNPQFSLPIDAKNIRVYDNFSVLSYSEDIGGAYNNITLSLSPDRYALRVGETFVYYVQYILPIENYLSISGDYVIINIDLLLGLFNCQVYHYISKLILPTGSSIVSFIGTKIKFENLDGSPIILFDEYQITPRDEINVNIIYNAVGAYWYLFVHPLLYALIIGCIASAYVITKRAIPFSKVEIKRKQEVSSSIVREFSILYEQKIAILMEVDKLDLDFQKRKIRSREYRKLLKTAEKNLSELDKSLDKLKPEFRSAGGRYKEIIDKLEILEGEKTTIKDSIARLQARYKRKQIKPIAYRKLNTDFQNRLKKIKSTMERIVQELRDIA